MLWTKLCPPHSYTAALSHSNSQCDYIWRQSLEEVNKMKKRPHKVKATQSCPTLCDPVDYTAHGILQVRILEWVAYPLLQGIFPTQGSNPGLLHCRRILYQLSYQGSPEVTWMSPNPIWKNSNTLRDIRHRSPREVIVRRQQPTSHGEDMPCWALHLGPVASGTALKSVVFCDSSPTWYVIIKNKLHNKMTIKNKFVINIKKYGCDDSRSFHTKNWESMACDAVSSLMTRVWQGSWKSILGFPGGSGGRIRLPMQETQTGSIPDLGRSRMPQSS